MTKKAWSTKDLSYEARTLFSCGTHRVIPSEQDSAISPALVANHSAGFGLYTQETNHMIDVPLNLKQGDSDGEDEEQHQEEEGEVDDVQVFADEKFDPEYRVSTWEQTILGKLL